MARHGPHHVAQKSTNTGVSDFKTSLSKFASVTSMMPLPAIVPPVSLGGERTKNSSSPAESLSI
jgi:hypothetical protein